MTEEDNAAYAEVLRKLEEEASAPTWPDACGCRNAKQHAVYARLSPMMQQRYWPEWTDSQREY